MGPESGKRHACPSRAVAPRCFGALYVWTEAIFNLPSPPSEQRPFLVNDKGEDEKEPPVSSTTPSGCKHVASRSSKLSSKQSQGRNALIQLVFVPSTRPQNGRDVYASSATRTQHTSRQLGCSLDDVAKQKGARHTTLLTARKNVPKAQAAITPHW